MQTDDEFVTISPLHVNGSRHCTKVGQCQDVIPFNCNTVKVLPAEIFEEQCSGRFKPPGIHCRGASVNEESQETRA